MTIEDSHCSFIFVLEIFSVNQVLELQSQLLTIMHSSIGRAGVQWNMPVLSYLRRLNIIYFTSRYIVSNSIQLTSLQFVQSQCLQDHLQFFPSSLFSTEMRNLLLIKRMCAHLARLGTIWSTGGRGDIDWRSCWGCLGNGRCCLKWEYHLVVFLFCYIPFDHSASLHSFVFLRVSPALHYHFSGKEIRRKMNWI